MKITFRCRFPHQVFLRTGIQFPVNSFGVVAGFVMAILFKFYPNPGTFTAVNSQHQLFTDQFAGDLKIIEFDKFRGKHN